MSRQMILVDTEDLKKKAQRLGELSEIFHDLGARVNRLCLSVPSYGGQLGTPAKNAAAQILYETGVMKNAYRAHDDMLRDIAELFEKTDETGIEYWIKYYSDAFQWSWNVFNYFFSGADSLGGDMINGYRQFLAYGESGTVITIWYGDQPLSFDMADPALSPEEREALRAKLARFKEVMQEALGHIKSAMGGDENLFMLALGMMGTGVNVKDIVTLLAKLGMAAAKIPDMEKELMQAEAALDEAGGIWDELNSQDLPGKVPTP